MNNDPLESRGRFVGALDVPIDLPLASIGSRGLALLLDMLVLVVALLFIAALFTLGGGLFEGAGPYLIAGFIVLLFLVYWGYFVAFELLMGGQSPGKLACRLRVVHLDGTTVGPLASLIRNFLRVIDLLPGTYGVGVLTMFLNDRARRLGDLAAGTFVIREPEPLLSQTEGFAWPPGFGPEDVSLVERFFRGVDRLPETRREELAAKLVAWIRAAYPDFVPELSPNLPALDQAYLVFATARPSPSGPPSGPPPGEGPGGAPTPGESP